MKTHAVRLASLLVVGWLVLGVGATGLAQQDETKTPSSDATTSASQAQPSEPDDSSGSESAQPSAQETASAPETPPEQEQPVSASPAPASAAAALESAPPVSSDASGIISVDFKDADIRQVLRLLSLKSGVDIVAGTDVEGLVTIKLTSVPWEQALDITLRTYGFTYERKGNIVRVMTLGALEQEALATEVFPLDYATAKDVPDVIAEMLSDRGKVKFDERTNTIIVTDVPSSLFQIRQVVSRLDQRTPQVLIEAKVVETKLTKDEKLGIDWSDSLSLTASKVSVPTTFPFPGGAEFGALSTFIPRAGAFSPGAGASLPKEGLVPEEGGTFTFGTLESSGLTATLNFLQSRTDTRIVSNPSISALNNQEARVHVGSEYPIPNYTIDATTGRPTISGYTPKNIGTVLTVTPHVNPSREIVVDLKPEVIAFSGNKTYDTGQGSSVSLPEFTTQTAETHVRIRDGETIAIGGLVKRSDTKTEAKIPILGDLPIIGLLFKNVTRYGSSDPVQQDLLIFLTVRLMDEPQAVAAAPSTP